MFRVNLTVCIAVWALKNTEKRRQRTQPRLVAGVVAPTFVGVNYLFRQPTDFAVTSRVVPIYTFNRHSYAFTDTLNYYIGL